MPPTARPMWHMPSWQGGLQCNLQFAARCCTLSAPRAQHSSASALSLAPPLPPAEARLADSLQHCTLASESLSEAGHGGGDHAAVRALTIGPSAARHYGGQPQPAASCSGFQSELRAAVHARPAERANERRQRRLGPIRQRVRGLAGEECCCSARATHVAKPAARRRCRVPARRSACLFSGSEESEACRACDSRSTVVHAAATHA